MIRRLLLCSVIACGCGPDKASQPASSTDPVSDIVKSTPAGQVSMHVFRDMVIVHNNSDTAATGCVITIDDAITGELGNAPAHQAVKLMRSRFRPYVEMDEFYQRGTIRKRLDCSAPSGPVRVEFGPSTEHSVVIPPKK